MREAKMCSYPRRMGISVESAQPCSNGLHGGFLYFLSTVPIQISFSGSCCCMAVRLPQGTSRNSARRTGFQVRDFWRDTEDGYKPRCHRDNGPALQLGYSKPEVSVLMALQCIRRQKLKTPFTELPRVSTESDRGVPDSIKQKPLRVEGSASALPRSPQPASNSLLFVLVFLCSEDGQLSAMA